LACFYCFQGQLQINDAGVCTSCSKNCCTHPSGRADNDFHAAACQCGCQKFVCFVDMNAHSQTHGSVPSSCFPALAGLISAHGMNAAAALAHAARGASRQDSHPGALSPVNLFLNAVSPGPDALLVTAATSLRTVSRARPVEGTQVTWLFLEPGAVTPTLLTRTLTLATRELARAANPLNEKHRADVFGASRLKAVDHLAAWARGQARLTLEAVAPLLRGTSGDDLGEALGGDDVLVQIEAALPSDRHELARWLFAEVGPLQ
jgi:hypothetical protein